MADFVELFDGSILNLDYVVRMHPPSKANKLETLYGSYTFADEEGTHVREAIRSKIAKPIKPRGRKKEEAT